MIFDAHLTLDSHIKSITKSTYHRLKNMAGIRSSCLMLKGLFMHTSSIDYCITCRICLNYCYRIYFIWSTCYISQMAIIYPEFSSTCSLIHHLVSISQEPFIVCIGCLFSRPSILKLSLYLTKLCM